MNESAAVARQTPADADRYDAADSAGADTFERLGALATDATKLAVLEAREAIGSAAAAVLLLFAAITGVLVSVVLTIVASVFLLHAVGLNWPLAFFAMAIIVLATCYLVFRRVGTLFHRLTLPQTRSALKPETT